MRPFEKPDPCGASIRSLDVARARGLILTAYELISRDSHLARASAELRNIILAIDAEPGDAD